MQVGMVADVCSIPIARSINLVDSVALPLLRLENGANWPEFWTQVGPNSCRGLDVRLPGTMLVAKEILASDLCLSSFKMRYCVSCGLSAKRLSNLKSSSIGNTSGVNLYRFRSDPCQRKKWNG